MGLFDAIIDVEKQIQEALRDAGKTFAEDLDCPIQEVRVVIAFKEDTSPYLLLFHKGAKIRAVQFDEII